MNNYKKIGLWQAFFRDECGTILDWPNLDVESFMEIISQHDLKDNTYGRVSFCSSNESSKIINPIRVHGRIKKMQRSFGNSCVKDC